MTDTTTTAETTPAAAHSASETVAVDTKVTLESPDAPVVPDDADETAGKSPNAEAAKWRTKLRAAEGERDQLAATLATLQCAEATRVAGVVLSQGADLFDIGGHDIADLLAEDGTVDRERVTELARELQLARPGLSRHGISNTHPNFGQVATGPATFRGGSKASWAGVLRGR